MKNLYIISFMIALLFITPYKAQDEFDNDPNIIKFQPADEFYGPSMIGFYTKSLATAKIFDPEELTDTVIFVFENVIEEHKKIPQNPLLSYIGSFRDQQNIRIHLYGKLRDSLWK